MPEHLVPRLEWKLFMRRNRRSEELMPVINIGVKVIFELELDIRSAEQRERDTVYDEPLPRSSFH